MRNGSARRRSAELVRRRIARAATGIVVEADVDAPAEERADGEHHGARAEFDARHRDDAAHAIAIDDQIAALLLEQREVRLVLERAADEGLVEHAIRLHARRTHRGALARVQRARLDRGRIGRARHDAAQRIDLFDEMALADAADGRVAAHLPQRLDALCQQQRARTHAGGRQRSFGARVAAAHDDYVKRCCRATEFPPDQRVKGPRRPRIVARPGVNATAPTPLYWQASRISGRDESRR